MNKLLTEFLIDLRKARLQLKANPSDENYRKVLNRFDIMLVGKDFNFINSQELASALINIYNISIDVKEFNEQLPMVCKSLNMKCESIGVNNNPIHSYQISLS
jgi:hypothetical protein